MAARPITIVIFGASGDLTHRKLIPALFHLRYKNRLPEGVQVVGLSRTGWTEDQFREDLCTSARKFMRDNYLPEHWEPFAQRLHYLPFDISIRSDFARGSDYLNNLEGGPADRLYYLATAPQFFPLIIQSLGQQAMLAEDAGWRRVIVEKPFGHDLSSARQLNEILHGHLKESQIYRIDHYLAKETVQNLLVFRFANTIFEPLWNRNYIDHVQITAAETVDVGHRGGYYDSSGILRDMFQNHLLQLMALVAMEAPASFGADSLRDERVKVLASIRLLKPEMVAVESLLGQYRGYRQAKAVAPDSRTPTFAAIRFYIDNWRWQGVPFYLRSGKALKQKTTQINIHFKAPPHLMFPLPEDMQIRSNILSICVQPDEGIHLRFEAKVPDTAADMGSVNMEFHYAEDFGTIAIPEAYERLLLDALRGDASLFTRADGIERAWHLVDPILEGIRGGDVPIYEYEPGSWGPVEAENFLGRESRAWHMGC